MITTKLSKLLLNFDCTLDGYEIESVDELPDGVIRCECDEDNVWVIRDQDVVVTDGETVAMARGYYDDDDDDEEEVSLIFTVRRPITDEEVGQRLNSPAAQRSGGMMSSA